MIEFQQVCIRAGDFHLKDISFEIGSGQYAVLMGRTGRGKTTILESLCGLRRVQSGKIMIRGMDVTDWAPGDREIGYVPQDLALFPTFSVAEQYRMPTLPAIQSSWNKFPTYFLNRPMFRRMNWSSLSRKVTRMELLVCET